MHKPPLYNTVSSTGVRKIDSCRINSASVSDMIRSAKVFLISGTFTAAPMLNLGNLPPPLLLSTVEKSPLAHR